MKYESDILKRLIDTYGVVGNPQYMSEIIKEFIVQGKECFPNLFTYQSDWLAHIDEFGLKPTYTVSYTGQSIYAPNTLESPVKSAILKGSTKYRDIDTGEVLDTFDEGRNLELVSVKMPVLKTLNNIVDFSNKNLEFEYGVYFGQRGDGSDQVNNKGIVSSFVYTLNYIELLTNQTRLTTYGNDTVVDRLVFFDENKTQILSQPGMNNSTINIPSGSRYLRVLLKDERFKTNKELAKDYIGHFNIYYGEKSGAYNNEPHKSNILTVNEDVTLRSNGDVCDELDLLTGKLTQRIDEDGEVLVQEVVKTVDLTIKDHNNQRVDHLKSFNGGTHFTTTSQDGSLLPTLTVDVVTDLEETLKVCSLDGNTL